jgi:hypothetical protein
MIGLRGSRRTYRRMRSRALARSLAALAGVVAIAGCGDTLQDHPIAHNTLESLIVAPYPVYWLGHSFQHMQITESTHDPGGAFTVQYGDCVEGGESTCVPPLRVVTSPDNQRDHTIEIATGGVVVGIYAEDAKLAAAAAQTLVPINAPGAPGEALPARRPDTGFGSTPLPSQVPSPLRALN